jgi:hypothetical protein
MGASVGLDAPTTDVNNSAVSLGLTKDSRSLPGYDAFGSFNRRPMDHKSA